MTRTATLRAAKRELADPDHPWTRPAYLVPLALDRIRDHGQKGIYDWIRGVVAGTGADPLTPEEMALTLDALMLRRIEPGQQVAIRRNPSCPCWEQTLLFAQIAGVSRMSDNTGWLVDLVDAPALVLDDGKFLLEKIR